MKNIALVDCNNFFAGCELSRHPEFLKKPLCVLSANGSNGGCIIARSYAAKALGIPMGAPYYSAKKQFPSAVFIKADLKFYGEISKKVMEKLYDFSPTVEQYSIDEAFLLLEGMETALGLTPPEIIKKIKKDIKKEIGIDVSVGLSGTKTLAKLACHKAKQGCGTFNLTPDLIEGELRSTKIEDIWGIGRGSVKKLQTYVIKTAFEFVSKDDEWIRKNFGKNGLETKAELLGTSVSAVVDAKTKKKSVQRTSTFENYSNDFDYIKTQVLHHLKSVFRNLRKHALRAKTLHVILKSKDFTYFEEKIVLKSSTNAELDVQKEVVEVLGRMFNPKLLYRASGVGASNLEDDESEQLTLFLENKSRKNNQKISKLLDEFDKKYGKNVVRLGES